MKNRNIINIMESFDNKLPIDTNLQGIKKINRNMIPKFVNGNWTSGTSTMLKGDIPTNTIRFKMKNLDSGIMYYKGKIYKIINVDYNGLITTEKKYGNQYLFSTNFNKAKDMRLPIDLPENIPTMKMISKGDDITETTVIFKFMKGKLEPVSREMVRADQVHPNISGLIYSKPSYENIKNYKFRYDAIQGEYTSINNLSNDYKNKLPKLIEKYNNVVTFQLLRYFFFANNNIVWTPYSRIYNIDIKKGNQVLTSLKFRKLKEELNENKLGNHYQYVTYLFIHKVDKFGVKYDYSEPNIVFQKNNLKLRNDADKYFENMLSAPNINSAQKEITSNFKPIAIKVLYNFDTKNIKNSNNIENKVDNILNNL